MIQLRHHMEFCAEAESEKSDCAAVEISPSEEYMPSINLCSESPTMSCSSGQEDEDLKRALEESLKEASTATPKVVRSVKDVIVNICEANDINLNSLEGGSLYIDVRRDFFMTDVIREGKKMKFDPKKKLSVHFVSDQGADTGGPSREFFHLLVKEGSATYMAGKSDKLTFVSNTIACQMSELEILVALSIVQGGPGFPALHPSVYNYIATRKYLGIETPEDDIPNPNVVTLIKKLNHCHDDDSITEVFTSDEFQDILYSTGYKKPTSVISVRDKRELIDALKCHFLIKSVIPEINELMEGLKVLGLLDYIVMYPKVMEELFVNVTPPLTAVAFKQLVKVEFSSRQSRWRAKEEATYVLFVDYLDMCEAGDVTVRLESLKDNTVTDTTMAVKDVLTFFTGADRVPPCGFPKEPKIRFLHNDTEVLATASTCDLEIRIPVKFSCNADKFCEMMTLSLKGDNGFGNI